MDYEFYDFKVLRLTPSNIHQGIMVLNPEPKSRIV